jgi:putative transposase
VIQIDGLHVGDHVLVVAIGIDGAGEKHVLALAVGATENAAVVKALLADLVERGLQPDIARLFIVDGAKALSRAVRDTFGRFALIQRCQVHKGAQYRRAARPVAARRGQEGTASGLG